MNNKKSIVYKALLIVGIVLIVASAFVPVFSLNLDALIEDLSKVAGPILEYFTDGVFGEESAEAILAQALGEEIAGIVETAEAFSLSDIYFTKGLVDVMEQEMDPEVWTMVSTVFKGIGFVAFIIPVLLILVATVMLVLKKNAKFAAGMVSVIAIYTTVFNVAFLFVANTIEKIILEEATDEFGMIITDKIFHVSLWPFVMVFAGIALCVVMAFLLSKKQNDSKVVVKKKDAVITFIEGELNGANIPLTAGEMQVIGREAGSAQIVLGNDPKVSRTHCKIEYSKKDNVVYITDMSSNGTVLGNGVKLAKDVKTPIESGTTVILSPASKFIIKY